VAERRAFSIAARSALAAGLVSAILLVVAGLWFRHAVYSGAMDNAVDRANEQARGIMSAVEAPQGRRNYISGYGEATFEVLESDGTLHSSSSDLLRFEDTGGVRLRAVMTPPPAKVIRSASADQLTVTFPSRTTYAEHPDEQILRWAGRTVRVVSDHRAVLPADLGRPVRDLPLESPTIGAYVFVPPFGAEQARADVDRVLWPAMPAGVLLVMLVAYLATRVGLRPVERIRAETAGMTSRDLHRRVPVPPTRDAVAQLATTLNETLDRLQRSSDQQRRFVADVTHELRSPVASLRAVLEVATTHADRADWPEVAGDAIEDLDRIQALIEDLLTLARFDADDLTATGPLDLAALVSRHLASRSSYDGIVVKAVTLEEATVDGNARELDRLVRNLVDNAERHARSTVEVAVLNDDGRAVLTVADDGPGIAAAGRTRVFERFVRLDDARSRGEGGAGLGLAIAHDIASRHGGRISARSSTAGGALLHVVLPLRGEH
jgi:signal transduction histidine kinase